MDERKMSMAELIETVNDEELVGDADCETELDVLSELAEDGWPGCERWLEVFNRVDEGDEMSYEERRKALVYLRAGEVDEEEIPEDDRI